VDEGLISIWRKLESIQKTGGVIILVAFGIAGKNRLRRKELAASLGVKQSRKEGGLISDKTLDRRLKKLIESNILEKETDDSDYPPGKYYVLTKKGEEILQILFQLIDKL